MTAIKLSQQLQNVASRWPVDPFRPHLQLGTFLKALADHPQLTPQAVRAARALEENEFQRKVRRLKSVYLYTHMLSSGVVCVVGKDFASEVYAVVLQ